MHDAFYTREVHNMFGQIYPFKGNINYQNITRFSANFFILAYKLSIYGIEKILNIYIKKKLCSDQTVTPSSWLCIWENLDIQILRRNNSVYELIKQNKQKIFQII